MSHNRRMMFWTLLLFLAGVAERAGGQVRGGPQASYLDGAGSGVGGRVSVGLVGLPSRELLAWTSSLDLFFPDDGTSWWELSTGLTLSPRRTGIVPYVGAGFGALVVWTDIPVIKDASDTRAGLQLQGGVRYTRTRWPVSPYAEVRWELWEKRRAAISVGILFGRSR